MQTDVPKITVALAGPDISELFPDIGNPSVLAFVSSDAFRSKIESRAGAWGVRPGDLDWEGGVAFNPNVKSDRTEWKSWQQVAANRNVTPQVIISVRSSTHTTASLAPTSEAVVQRIGGPEQAPMPQNRMYNDLGGQITGQNVEYPSLSEQFAELAAHLQGQITDLKNENTQMRGDITGLDNENTRMRKQITGQQKQITGLENENTQLRGKITGQQNQITGQQKQITGLENEITQLRGKITGQQNQITGQQKQITGLENEITQQKEVTNTQEVYIRELMVSHKRAQMITLRGMLERRRDQLLESVPKTNDTDTKASRLERLRRSPTLTTMDRRVLDAYQHVSRFLHVSPSWQEAWDAMPLAKSSHRDLFDYLFGLYYGEERLAELKRGTGARDGCATPAERQ
ncbi:unnamed protein product [Phytophthora fragariaefolia]|uniref:Unnamed protein product n=1 Tax=Phytophthora fragariaefolia TaxID=1490495 RepID=A0A9W6THU3_9STRA|nr:unnamed protein product [Phytophthora fragariaefolia]